MIFGNNSTSKKNSLNLPDIVNLNKLQDFINLRAFADSEALKINSRPPMLSLLCEACRKIGNQIPEHFLRVRHWSEIVSVDGVRWDASRRHRSSIAVRFARRVLNSNQRKRRMN